MQPFLQWKSNNDYTTGVCNFSLRYPEFNKQEPHFQRSDPFYNIFPQYLKKGTIFENTLLDIKCAFRFSLQYLSEIRLILRRTKRYMIKMYIGIHVRQLLVSSDFNEI